MSVQVSRVDVADLDQTTAGTTFLAARLTLALRARLRRCRATAADELHWGQTFAQLTAVAEDAWNVWDTGEDAHPYQAIDAATKYYVILDNGTSGRT